MLQYSYRRNAPPTRMQRRGPDQTWMSYSPLIDRPPLRWPDGARIALWICPCVLHYEFMPPTNPWLDAWARTPPPDVMGYARQEYGSRAGFWRLLRTLDRAGARCTSIVNSVALELFPDIAAAIRERRWDVAGHGMLNTEFLYDYDESRERAYYRKMLESVERTTGVRMKGMGGPGPQAATESTPDLLAEEGFLYYTDFFCDDQPFPLHVRSGRLVSIPYSVEVNDSPVLSSAFEGEVFLDIVKRRFDRLYQEGAHSGRVMCISLHPVLFGQPHRIRYLEEALEYVLSFPHVWQATGAEIAEYYLANAYEGDLLSRPTGADAP